jgi:hypothetical protein
MIDMKFRMAMVAFACLFLTRCAAYYNVVSFTNPKSTFYTEQEKKLLEKTVKSIEFDSGYDPSLNLDYVYPLTQGFTEFKAGDKDLSRALDDSDSQTVIGYSEKIYRLKTLTEMKKEKYRGNGDWKNYTFIDKYLLPPLNHYSGVLEKQAVKRDRKYQGEIEKRKNSIEKEVKYEMDRKEFDDIWKNDYNS